VKLRRDAPWPICLIWSGEGRHPRAALFLQGVSDTEVAVTSVVPLDQRDLAADDCQAALDAFRASLVLPRGKDLVVEDRPLSSQLSEAVSARALACFRAFARMANKTSHPSSLDLARWSDFLIQLHLDQTRPPQDVLEEALKGEGFSDEAIQKLLEGFQMADVLLTRYDACGEKE
jgi:hypothetical protein